MYQAGRRSTGRPTEFRDIDKSLWFPCKIHYDIMSPATKKELLCSGKTNLIIWYDWLRCMRRCGQLVMLRKQELEARTTRTCMQGIKLCRSILNSHWTLFAGVKDDWLKVRTPIADEVCSRFRGIRCVRRGIWQPLTDGVAQVVQLCLLVQHKQSPTFFLEWIRFQSKKIKHKEAEDLVYSGLAVFAVHIRIVVFIKYMNACIQLQWNL